MHYMLVCIMYHLILTFFFCCFCLEKPNWNNIIFFILLDRGFLEVFVCTVCIDVCVNILPTHKMKYFSLLRFLCVYRALWFLMPTRSTCIQNSQLNISVLSTLYFFFFIFLVGNDKNGMNVNTNNNIVIIII